MNENISIIGVGRLGLCLALNLEKCGYNIIGVDVVQSYIDEVNKKTFISPEPQITEMLKTCKNLYVTSDLQKALVSEILFVVVHTPSLKSGEFDHKYINKIISELITYGIQPNKKYLVISSTVEPGYCDSIREKMAPFNYDIIYNPEFIAQGSIIKDQLNPDMLLIGTTSEESADKIEKIYLNMCKKKLNVCKMKLMEAEITKIALNCYITTKISYANMVGDVAINLGLNPDVILAAIGTDSRIGNKYLKWGFGFGGPCFPRDNRMFGIFCEENGIYPHISYATEKSNQSHLNYQIKTFIKNNPDKTIPITLSSITYKENTNIIEESQKLRFAEELERFGYKVIIIESPEVVQQLKRVYEDKFLYREKI